MIAVCARLRLPVSIAEETLQTNYEKKQKAMQKNGFSVVDRIVCVSRIALDGAKVLSA